MDTKLKKSKFYSGGFKTFAIFLIVLFTLGFVSSSMGIFWATYNFDYGFSPISNSEFEDYTETRVFIEDFRRLIDEAVDVNILYKSEGNIREGKAVNEDDLIREFKNYYGVADGIITSSTEITDDYSVNVISDSIPEELMDNFYEYSELVSTKLRGYRVYIFKVN